ncbi:DoxX family protein [Solimonas sp. K1W22B-7]|uniref:DoxX family protein n=1 Tax=Solimonas sp. K1W22B-7 TaxID=2303331 RepID=UPI000E331BF2|nr:DoxX family protein [Solimonas sp. K1W22B-7]AXQ27520.1 DoxX family protein [Solimonas sp. K1W22B-7]
MKPEGRLPLWLCRFGLCLAFLYSGLAKLSDFPAALAEQAHFGLEPPALFAVLTIAVQLGGSALVLFTGGRLRALGAFALAGFTVLATLIGHAFWTMDGMERFHNLNAFLEHAGLVGGFIMIAVLALREGHGAAA